MSTSLSSEPGRPVSQQQRGLRRTAREYCSPRETQISAGRSGGTEGGLCPPTRRENGSIASRDRVRADGRAPLYVTCVSPQTASSLSWKAVLQQPSQVLT